MIKNKEINNIEEIFTDLINNVPIPFNESKLSFVNMSGKVTNFKLWEENNET